MGVGGPSARDRIVNIAALPEPTIVKMGAGVATIVKIAKIHVIAAALAGHRWARVARNRYRGANGPGSVNCCHPDGRAPGPLSPAGCGLVPLGAWRTWGSIAEDRTQLRCHEGVNRNERTATVPEGWEGIVTSDSRFRNHRAPDTSLPNTIRFGRVAGPAVG